MYNLQQIQDTIQGENIQWWETMWQPSVFIDRFSRTKLSNFYPVRVNYNNVIYPSVEHWYQSQKFKIDSLLDITKEQFLMIEEELRLKWCSVAIPSHIANIFTDRNLSSWNIKMIVSMLQERWFQDPLWEEHKFRVMLDLLIKKRTQNEELANYLLSTKPAMLIEWNDRNDTYRWISNKRWHNYLWKILMYIRDKILTSSQK